MANATSLKLMLVGDLILDEPDPDSFFEFVRSVLQQADLLVGHVEVPHTRRGRENTSDVPAPASDPKNLTALKRAGSADAEDRQPLSALRLGLHDGTINRNAGTKERRGLHR